jgi:hypothetical protein
VSVIAGMARVIRALGDYEEPEHRALAQAGHNE